MGFYLCGKVWYVEKFCEAAVVRNEQQRKRSGMKKSLTNMSWDIPNIPETGFEGEDGEEMELD